VLNANSPSRAPVKLHANARLVPATRLVLVQRVLEEHWKVGDVAAAFGISERTAYRWLARWRYQSIACSSSINETTAVSSEDLHTLRRLTDQTIATLPEHCRRTCGPILAYPREATQLGRESSPPEIGQETTLVKRRRHAPKQIIRESPIGRAAHSPGSTTRLVAKGARLAHLLRHTDVEAGSGGGDCSSRRRIVSSSAVATGP